MDVSWIRIKLSLFDDEKIKIIESLPDGDSIILMWIKILILAGKSNNSGYLTIGKIPYTDQMLSAVLSKPESLIRISIKTLIDLGMIEIDNGRYFITNWGKHQNVDGLDLIRKQTADRVKKLRENRKLLPYQKQDGNVTCNVTCNDDVTERNADVTQQNKNKNKKENKNKNIDIRNKEIEKNEKHSRVFIIPSLEEISEYFILKNSNKEEASRMLDYYTSNGWMVGKSKMKNWQAAANNWIRNVEKFKTSNGKPKVDRDRMWADFINGK